MRVLVTGASGYVGGQVRTQLLERRFDVVALSRVRGAQGSFRCLVSGEVGDLDRHLVGVDSVIHLAGRLVDDPKAGVVDYFTPNVGFTDEVLAAAVRAGVTSFVHASSRLVYPSTLKGPAVEDRDADPDTAYGISKRWAEDVVRFRSRESGINAISLRIGQVTGGVHLGLGVINSFVKQARRDRRVVVHGTGSAVRDVVHVEDVARALVAAMDHRGPWVAVNVGGTRPVTISQIAEMVAACAPGVDIQRVVAEKEDSSCYALSQERVRRTLSWVPTWSPEAIIKAAYGREETD